VGVLAMRLLEVTFLELNGLKWHLLHENTQTTIMSAFQKVTRLESFACGIEPSHELSQFISSFPSSRVHTWWKLLTESLTAPHTPLPSRLATITPDSHIRKSWSRWHYQAELIISRSPRGRFGTTLPSANII